MFAVTVTLEIDPAQMQKFLPLMHYNAAISVMDEPGCHQFDVCTDPKRPDEVFLYECYTDAAAFKAHLDTPHFKSFDRSVKDMIKEKTIQTYALVTR